MSQILMVMGLPGSGKSYFAKKLAHAIHAKYTGSDELRKKMGLMGHYDLKSKQQVYQAMINKAEKEILNQRNVVLDATFFLKNTRKLVEELGEKYRVDVVPILVEAEEKIIGERLSKPRKDSEADFQVYRQIKEAFEPLEGPYLTLVSTNENIEEILEKTLHHLKSRHGKN
ncbi:AAA family ATPase [Shivajiella indica]|uniref:AAA family ATPase n=1 Tax=Shivajiella indica TaxID=872115 RepID=A0ABW5B8N1_9BACT